jgi:hypothetical protein
MNRKSEQGFSSGRHSTGAISTRPGEAGVGVRRHRRRRGRGENGAGEGQPPDPAKRRRRRNNGVAWEPAGRAGRALALSAPPDSSAAPRMRLDRRCVRAPLAVPGTEAGRVRAGKRASGKEALDDKTADTRAGPSRCSSGRGSSEPDWPENRQGRRRRAADSRLEPAEVRPEDRSLGSRSHARSLSPLRHGRSSRSGPPG